MRSVDCLVASLLVVGPVAGVEAQRFTAEVRPVVASPSRLAGADLEMGFGFGATMAVQLQPHLHAYAGWDWLQFGSNDSFAGLDHDFGETGYTFGLRFEHPLGDASRMQYRLEGGGTYKHVEIENEGGDIIADSKHALGFELGLGVLWPTADEWRVGPTVRYRSLQPDFDIGGATTAGTLRYVGLELAVSRRF